MIGLVEVVQLLEAGTVNVPELRQLVDEWEVVDVLVERDWSQLRPALLPLCPPSLPRMFQRATGHRLPGPPEWCDNAWRVFVHLAGQNAGPDGLSPGLVFLVLLEQEVAEPRVVELIRHRNQEVASAQKITAEYDERRADLLAGRDQPTETTAYLVIQVEPEFGPGEEAADDGEGTYLLTYVRQWHGSGSWHSWPGPSCSVRREQLESAVERVIEKTEQDWWDRPGTVMIEFILPWALLNEDVDWWRKESRSTRPTALAMDYPIVVRSLERLRTRRWHRVWHERWRRLRSSPTQCRTYWSQPAGEDYFTRLETELKADDQVVSLVLSEPPVGPGRTGQQEAEAALRAGLPVIIWHRADCGSVDFRAAVKRLISDRGLAQLPMRAKELRLAALGLEPDQRDSHIGRHLTVLWDDPERRPEHLGHTSGRAAGELR
jgi:hypothetical protein